LDYLAGMSWICDERVATLGDDANKAPGGIEQKYQAFGPGARLRSTYAKDIKYLGGAVPAAAKWYKHLRQTLV
jgi:hypothetical protein